MTVGRLDSRAALLALALSASFLVHAKGLFAPPLDLHHHRQVNTSAIARNYHERGLRFHEPQIDWEGPSAGRAATEFPLYMWLTGRLWPLLGLGDAWGRILSVLFSALTAVYLMFFLERRGLSRREAGAASILFSFIPLEIYFGRTVQPEALALLSTTASLYHWDRSLDKGRPWLHWAAAALWAFLAISHKLPYAYILLPLAALAWLRLGDAAFKDARVYAAPLLTLAAVWAWYRWASGSGVYVVPSKGGEFWGMLEYDKLPRYIRLQFASRLPELALTYPGAIFFAFGARELWKRGERFFFVWWGSIALSLIAYGGYAFHHEYSSLPLAPVNAAIMSVGLWALLKRARGGQKAAVWLLAAAIPFVGLYRVKHWYSQKDYAFLANAAKAASAVSSPEDLFVTNQRAASVYLYYLRRRGWSWDIAEAGANGIPWLEEKIAQGARFYMTRKSGVFADNSHETAAWIRKNFELVFDQDDILIFKLRGRSNGRS